MLTQQVKCIKANVCPLWDHAHKYCNYSRITYWDEYIAAGIKSRLLNTYLLASFTQTMFYHGLEYASQEEESKPHGFRPKNLETPPQSPLSCQIIAKSRERSGCSEQGWYGYFEKMFDNADTPHRRRFVTPSWNRYHDDQVSPLIRRSRAPGNNERIGAIDVSWWFDTDRYSNIQ